MNLFNILRKANMELPEPKKALKGRSTSISIINNHNLVLHSSMVRPFPSGVCVVYFGMGCFWGAEKLFWQVKGVYTTAVGYGAGYTPNPTYEEVCSGMTGHNEVVMVVYNPKVVSFHQLLSLFWENHNPTEGMKQGNDIGTQYRSAIYTETEECFKEAQSSKCIYDAQLFNAGMELSTTEVLFDVDFYYAEDYHQQYLAKNPLGYCPSHSFKSTGLPAFPGLD